MEQTTRLYRKLQHCTIEHSDWAGVYDDFVERLMTLEAGHTAPGPGTRFPDLVLPDHLGQHRDLAALRGGGPVVVSFIRGGWCPWCRSELEIWRETLDALHAAGGRLVVIVGEIGGRAERIAQLLDGRATVLCDVDHGAALNIGLAFHAGADLIRQYLAAGLDLADIYGTDSGILPVPATFVIDTEGMVRFAFVDPDFRLRAEPADTVAVVRALAATDPDA
jgi:peroxiredoxin